MTVYNHTQVGRLMIYVVAIIVIFYGTLYVQTGFETSLLVFIIIILLIIASFASLNVTVDKSHLRIKFGWGIYSKSFLLEEIISVRSVKNHWYYGWGIRHWSSPKMWIFNVSGFEAVEITMRSGKIYRIGTDEPQRLENILQQNIKK